VKKDAAVNKNYDKSPNLKPPLLKIPDFQKKTQNTQKGIL